MQYDVIVVGAGHAGCEAALAAARMGCQTLLLTMSLDNVALMPCNPSIGGPAKGHVVREIDALGGEMARNIDRTFIQIRRLNTGHGPAVQALRAQADKRQYQVSMREALERQANLHLKQALVDSLVMREEDCSANYFGPRRITGVVTSLGQQYWGKTVILTTGTSLRGRIIVGDVSHAGGRSGESDAMELSRDLLDLGFRLRRLKTGTPPRLDARTIDFSLTRPQYGNDHALFFSADAAANFARGQQVNPAFLETPACDAYPGRSEGSWRAQLPCYQVHTNERTHQVIRDNLHRAPLFTGIIEGVGPRYCPSIEDKIVRFADKPSHGLFLEPEGWNTSEVYVQGANTSLPEDVQLKMLRTIPALARAEMVRVGYAIEYDAVDTKQIGANLETRLVEGLFLAGQINGTSGYEEAAGQGLIAGINAARKVQGKQSLILRRDQAYIGVMIDDLITGDYKEPYRLFTSRAEYRLLLRQDNADLRLAEIGFDMGLLSSGRLETVQRKRELVENAQRIWGCRQISVGRETTRVLEKHGLPALDRSMPALELLRRNEITATILRDLAPLDAAEANGDEHLVNQALEQVELGVKYETYINKQLAEVERVRKLEEYRIPAGLDFTQLTGLRNEAKLRLREFGPATLGQCSRVSGVTPSDVSIVLVHLERARRTRSLS